MRVVTWNLNGIRAAIRKGLADILDEIQPDVLLFQEIRATPEQLTAAWRAPEGWHVLWHPAEKKGYAGTAVWSRTPITEISRGIGGDDLEGRLLEVEIDGVRLASVYLPSGSSSDERQTRKEAWMAEFRRWMDERVAGSQPYVVAGDLNIAHTANDIHNPTGNKKNSGFLPHEREWFTELLQSGWRDTVRDHIGEQKGPYSWWSNRGRARELDRGWRIDYVLANPAAGVVEAVQIHRQAGITVSDHAPVIVDFSA